MPHIQLPRLATLLLIISSLSCAPDKDNVLFEDNFGPESQGELRQNIVQLPPPEGLGTKWKVLEKGYDPLNWKIVDELGPDDPNRGFWVVHPDSAFLQQGGISHNSVLFCRTPLPYGSVSYDISFRQYRGDNGYIGYIIGAKEMELNQGIEFGYVTRVPGTDSTVNDAFIAGTFGEKVVTGMALMNTWAEHRIEVRGNFIAWYINDSIVMMGEQYDYSTDGHFGIRQKYDRNTRYDDVRIMVYRSGPGLTKE